MKKEEIKPIFFSSIIDTIIFIITLFLGFHFISIFCMTDQVLLVLFLVFLLTKIPVTYFVSKRKNKLEKGFNYFITILFGLIEFLTLFSMFNDTQQWILLFSIFTIFIESFIKEKSNSRAILTGTFLIVFVIIFSILLFFIDSSSSALVSATTAVITLLFETDTLEDVFNIKVSKQRQQQLSLIKISILFLIPVIYTTSLIFPRTEFNNGSFYTVLLTGLYRFIILEITYPLFLS